MTSLLGLMLALLVGAFVALMLLANALVFLLAGCVREVGARLPRRMPALPGTPPATAD